jgi:hypothetical protein
MSFSGGIEARPIGEYILEKSADSSFKPRFAISLMMRNGWSDGTRSAGE